MSFIQRELDRIEVAMKQPQFGDSYEKLYAARQALAWALEPIGFAAPFASITGNPEAPIDCSGRIRPPLS